MNSASRSGGDQPRFISQVDVPALLTEFLQNIRTEEVVTELLQNELDQGATETTISFLRDRLVSEGNGRPVDKSGWEGRAGELPQSARAIRR